VVPISATAGSGYTFSSWSATGSIVIASASSASTTATINGAGTITAAFTQNVYTLTVTVNPTGGGTVTPDKSPPYHLNDIVKLTETPSPGYMFSSWSGDGTGTGATRTVTMNGNKAVTATFTQITYTLTIRTSGSGSTNPSTGRHSYGSGSQVQVTATPASGWYFSHWHLDGVDAGLSNPTTVTMNSAHTLQAVFTQMTYTLTISVTGSGSTNPAVGGHVYSQGSIVQVTASPVAGWSLDHWVLDGSLAGSANPYTVTMDSGHTLGAVFTQSRYTLTVSTSGQGSVSKVPSQATYAYGSSVQLTATPASGWAFSGWSGGASGTANPLTIVMNDDKAVTATFTQNTYTLTVNVSPSAGGTVTRSSNGPYHLNDVVTLTEAPSAGYMFSGWSGDGTGSGTTRTVTITGNMAATATFTQNQYQVVFATSGSGTTSPSGTQTYAAGAVVPISATAGSGYTFSSWSATGSIVIASASSASTTATINGAGTITAAFTQIQYTLTVTTVGSGSVAKAPSQVTYASGSSVQLTATPAAGYVFAGWSGGLSGSANPATVTMSGNKAVTATFTQIQYTLTVSTVGQGTVSRSPDQASYASGSTVQLTATPAAGWSFSGWSGDASGSSSPLTVSMTGNKAFTATFTQNQYTLTVNTSGQGSVAKSPSQATYTYGSSVQLTATPASGWAFTGWSGDLSGSANPATVTMSGDKAVTATFTQNVYTLTVTVNPTGGGTVTPDKSPPYHLNDVVVLTEAPSVGYTFSGWSGDGSGSGTTRTVTITGNMAVTAAFTQIQYTLGIYSDSACTTPKTDISWGDLQPGSSTHQTVYIKNTGNVAATLSCTFGNWVPSGAASYITVTWDKEGAPIAPNESVAATFTLTVSPSITGITTFSVEINIIATQA
jgi:uncharacterized repeat protein (TIGR02543 family)